MDNLKFNRNEFHDLLTNTRNIVSPTKRQSKIKLKVETRRAARRKFPRGAALDRRVSAPLYERFEIRCRAEGKRWMARAAPLWAHSEKGGQSALLHAESPSGRQQENARQAHIKRPALAASAGQSACALYPLNSYNCSFLQIPGRPFLSPREPRSSLTTG